MDMNSHVPRPRTTVMRGLGNSSITLSASPRNLNSGFARARASQPSPSQEWDERVFNFIGRSLARANALYSVLHRTHQEAIVRVGVGPPPLRFAIRTSSNAELSWTFETSVLRFQRSFPRHDWDFEPARTFGRPPLKQIFCFCALVMRWAPSISLPRCIKLPDEVRRVHVSDSQHFLQTHHFHRAIRIQQTNHHPP